MHSFMQVEQNQSFWVGREDREGPNNPPPPVLCIPRSLPFLFPGFLLLAPFPLPSIKHFCVILPHISSLLSFPALSSGVPHPIPLSWPNDLPGSPFPPLLLGAMILMGGYLDHSNKRELGHQATKLTEDGCPVPVMSAASYPSET